MNTSTTPEAQKIQGPQQNKVAKCRSQRDFPFVSYKEFDNDLDELEHKPCRYGANCIIRQCNCVREEQGPVPIHYYTSISTKEEQKQSEAVMKSDKFNIREFMYSLFAKDIVEWEQNKNRSGVAENVENEGLITLFFNTSFPPPPFLINTVFKHTFYVYP